VARAVVSQWVPCSRQVASIANGSAVETVTTVAGTGRGKTVCGYYATYQLQRKTLVITTSVPISTIEQMAVPTHVQLVNSGIFHFAGSQSRKARGPNGES
jgi:superfamily II DNA or RNA helicase